MVIEPFRALRFAASGEELGSRLAPQELAADLRELARRQPLHAVFLLTSGDPKAALARWKEKGALVEDGPPALYVLELGQVRQPAARMLLGAVPPGSLPHALEQGASLPAHPSIEPVPALAADDHQVFRQMLAEATGARPADLESRAGPLALRLWRLASSKLTRRLIHHLAETRVRPLLSLPERERGLLAVAPLPDPGFRIWPIHRGLRELETFHPDRFLTVVAAYAAVYELDEPLTHPQGLALARERLASLATGHHAVLLVLPGGEGRILRFRQRLELAQQKAAPKDPTLRSLDLALLNSTVLKTVLGVGSEGDPRVVPVDSLEELVERVTGGELQGGFGLNPPPAWELRAVMEAEQVLPPRTLRMEPLPPAGLLFLAP